MGRVTVLRERARSWLGTAIAPRLSLMLGIAMTMTMNITAGLRYHVGGALAAAAYALALLVSLETLVWQIRRTTGWTWQRWASLLSCALCAAITGWVSYDHARAVLSWTGTTGPVARYAPLLPDQLIFMGSLALISVAVHRKRTRTVAPEPADQPAGPPDRTTGPDHEPHRPVRDPVAEAQLVDVVRGLPKVPAERACAAPNCGGNRRMARRGLAAARGGGDG